eukprot:CAMPEP_0206137386 /NCGR_PEP_ID=MMETSP1473-20131121/2522_1 /ASSEMBLY_ACC=CAM_ASM_001109 /TAXON_ID=1461547 /ORGANISM="Stichococcus sp, Strain RCC1054" /LENGTH=630 /DNA_ID=CAMNT_0053530445 /DNA_START=352 /DNA_END=2243 /DNA_ORIENTATION=-
MTQIAVVLKRDVASYAQLRHPTRREWLASSASVVAAALLQDAPADAAIIDAREASDASAAPLLDSSNAGQLVVADVSNVASESRLGQAAGAAFSRPKMGLVPANLGNRQKQLDRAWAAVNRCCTDLDKYQALMLLRDTESDVFLALAAEHAQDVLPILYTPTVAQACTHWSELLRRSPGLYISLDDQGRVPAVVNSWPEKDIRIAVLTDGERILGLGDIGANGMGIPVGKSTVYAIAAGIDPRQVLPVGLDTGCDVDEVRDAPFYAGLPRRRARGPEYDELVAETVAALRERYGPALLIHWEDFSSRNSYRLLQRFRDQGVPTFNDDIESTAAAVVAAVLGAARLQSVPPLAQQHFVFVGAGQANIGSARLLTRALVAEGLSQEEARSRMWLYDSKGLVYRGRKEGGLTPQKLEFARSEEEGRRLGGEAQFGVEAVGATCLVGAAARRGTFTRDALQALTRAVERRAGKGSRPIVLALSNPKESAECTAQEAYDYTSGAAVFASGTAFPPTSVNGQDREPAQANNSLVFPGIGLGCIAAGATQVTDGMMLEAARAVAAITSPADLRRDCVLPDASRLREVAVAVAAAVAAAAKAEGVSSSAALACLPELGHSTQRNENCLKSLQHELAAV